MGYSQKLPSYISPEDYLLLEERALTKHEYLDGVIYDWQGAGPRAMAGGSKQHNTASLNIYTSLRAQLSGTGCSTFVADIKVASADESAYFYPDVVVSCSESDRASPLFVRQPTLIVEVLSTSTELFDRGDKFASYRALESLLAYVLVSTDLHTVELATRAGGWVFDGPIAAAATRSETKVELGFGGLHLVLADVFDGI